MSPFPSPFPLDYYLIHLLGNHHNKSQDKFKMNSYNIKDFTHCSIRGLNIQQLQEETELSEPIFEKEKYEQIK